MLSTTASYLLLSRDLQRSLNNIAEQPQNTRDIEYYQQNITNVKSIDDLLGDDRLYQFAMRAFGLEDMIMPRRSCARCSMKARMSRAVLPIR